jgi:glucose/arabinose dehydrogenase
MALLRPLAALLVALVLIVGLGGCSITDAPTSVTETGATLNGRVHPRQGPTEWWFEWGTTSAYGNTTPRTDAGTADEVQRVSRRITGLTAGTTYHYRLCDLHGDDPEPQCGDDVAFTTPSGRLRPGFQEVVAFSGLTQPTALRFAADGRAFVAEKSGLIKVFDGVDDQTPTVFADLRTKVHNFWDRGLLGMALAPNFPADPSVYVLYTYDAAIGGTAPRWGTAGATSDGCPSPPGPTSDGCVVSGRLSRLTADGDTAVGPEQVLVEDWCQQYPSHSVGSLAFGRDGALYASAGDGASFTFADYGQAGQPQNPCGDPPGAPGTALSPPLAEGGALRSQDVRTGTDPAGLDGTVIRIDPATGHALPGNAGASSDDPNVRRIVAYGLRNPFRITTRPGTDEVWVGDVGWNDVEEINRLTNPTDAADNFGWPCYEGAGRQASYDGAQLNLCEDLYGAGGHVAPFHSYRHADQVVPGESCRVGSSAVAGVAFGFYPNGPYPAEYDGALFFADNTRDCIWAMLRNGGANPDPNAINTFVQSAFNPVDVQVAPSGELFYVDFDGGTVRRIVYSAGNQPPVAVATADRTSGALPLTVAFDGSTSDDPDSGAPLTFAWDLDADGQFDDSSSATPSFTYTAAGSYRAQLRVTDAQGATATDAVTITAGNTPPVATIAAPSPGLRWDVGDTIAFQGSAVDDQDGTLGAGRLSWSLILHHCPSNCHTHAVQSWPGVASGSFEAPDHDYPSHLELRLTATDSGGLSDTQSLRLDPRTVNVTMRSTPSGLTLSLGGTTATTPFTRTVIAGGTTTIAAPSPQTLGPTTYTFGSWSDGGARTHNVTPGSDTTYTATFSP